MIGKQIGRYRITAELGRGGMGVVYRATQVTLNRTVAVKLLFPHLAGSAEYLARFRREAETLARLDHENIVRIYDVEEYEDTHCIVMEYVGGPSLSRVLAREGRLAPNRARAVAADLASALSAAHRQGIIHRDIKPDNILFSLDGRPKLTDFGIARIADGSQATRTGIMIGTPSWMSPEQASGRPVTAASDLYSLGVVLYEMLAGRVPFEGGDALAIALMHVNERPPALSSLVPGLPAPLCEAVTRLLAKNPADRFGSAAALREALLAIELPVLSQAPEEAPAEAGASCPECGHALRADFLTCPKCGLSIRQRCARCERMYDPLSPECPFCRTPATPTPTPVPAVTGSGPARSVDATVVAAGAPPVATGAMPAASGSSPATGAMPAAASVREGPPSVNSRAASPRRLRSDLVALLARVAGSELAGRPAVALWAGAAVLVVALGLAIYPLIHRQSPEAPVSPVTTPARAEAAGGGPEILRATLSQGAAQRPLTAEEVAAISRAAGDSAEAAGAGAGTAEGGRKTGSREDDKPAGDTARAESPPRTQPAGQPEGKAAGNPAAAEVAERAAIEEIVERQHRATETGDLALLLQDVAPELHEGVRASFRDMQESARNIQSEISRVTVEFREAGVARVAFDTKLTGRRIKDGRTVTIFDGRVVWALERRSGRWLITVM